MSFDSFLAYSRRSHDEMPLYLFDKHFASKAPQLAADYKVASISSLLPALQAFTTPAGCVLADQLSCSNAVHIANLLSRSQAAFLLVAAAVLQQHVPVCIRVHLLHCYM